MLFQSEIGNIIESVTKPKGYSIVTRYTGHGINQLVRVCCCLLEL